jgi:hypothetical protein
MALAAEWEHLFYDSLEFSPSLQDFSLPVSIDNGVVTNATD